MNKNKIKEPLIIVSFAIVLLFVLSLSKNPHIFGLTFKPFSLFSDILNEKADTAINDSNRIVIKDTIKRDLSNIVDYKNDSALNRFFESLRKTKAGHHQTRIAYFGDSYIEGDLVTQDFRKLLQDEFGGGGVGYMPITSIVASFRSSVIHTFEGWKTYSYVKHPPDSHNLFISGYVFSPVLYDEADTSSDKAISRVRYSGVARPRLNSFNRIRLFYGNSKGNNTVNISGAIYPLNAPGILNQVEIKSKTNFRSVDADFKCVSSIDIYGMSLESDTGVIVDNFSFRGNSGLPMQMVWPAMYNQSNLYLGYDLIIIEYGLNAITEKATEYHWYERGFLSTIRFMKKCYPNTDILIIGLGDKALRINGKYEEDPAVRQILALEQNAAMLNRVAYWSLYDAMGGEGSIIRWADSTITLANKDYTHLTARGGKKVAELLFEKLMNKYKMYQP